MNSLTRRGFLLGSVAAATAVAMAAPAHPVQIAWDLAAPGADKTVAWVVGSSGESNWQFIRAIDEHEAMDVFMCENCSEAACEVDATNPPDDCDCEWCATLASLEFDRMKRWDHYTYKNEPKPVDWVNAGMHCKCACGIEIHEIDDSVHVLEDGNLECDWCHDRRIKRDRAAAAQSLAAGIGATAAIGHVAGMEAQKACGHADAPGADGAVSGCLPAL